jgi:hypothetical protein
MSYQGYYPPQQNVYHTTQYATVNTPQSWWGYFLNQITPQQLGIIRVSGKQRQINEYFGNIPNYNHHYLILGDL